MTRLIDAEALFKECFPNADINADDISNLAKYPYWETDITGIQSMLKNAPTVDAVTADQCKELIELNRKLISALGTPRPVGKWVDITPPDYFTPGGEAIVACSNCHARESQHLAGVEGAHWDFCPICGADMRGQSL